MTIEPRALQVNGEPVETSAKTLREYLDERGLDPRTVAVEHNGAVIRRELHGETPLEAGDRLEIVRFVQGG